MDDRLADLEIENAGLAEVGTRPLSALPSSTRDLDLDASTTGALNMTSFSDMFDISWRVRRTSPTFSRRTGQRRPGRRAAQGAPSCSTT